MLSWLGQSLRVSLRGGLPSPHDPGRAPPGLAPCTSHRRRLLLHNRAARERGGRRCFPSRPAGGAVRPAARRLLATGRAPGAAPRARPVRAAAAARALRYGHRGPGVGVGALGGARPPRRCRREEHAAAP